MSKTKITYQRASTAEELKAILNLQQKNLSETLSEDEKSKEGFVTLKHDFEVLEKMNDACPHCIAKSNDKVVGYALCMLQEFRNDVPLLVPMFNEVDNTLKEQHLKLDYVVMGQICIDKSMRGQGIFRGLYSYMSEELKEDFDVIITEVDAKNKRSSNAHLAIGFKIMKKYESNSRLWELIVLETK